MNNKIKEYIDKNHLKIASIVQETGISRSYFYDLMNGKCIPSLVTARKISSALKVRLDELFPDDNLTI